MDALGGVETETIEMKFCDPVTPVANEKFADRSGVFAVEVNRVTPFVLSLAIDVILRVNAKVISVRPEMIINNVKDHTQIKPMRAIDKCAQVVRGSVKVRWSK